MELNELQNGDWVEVSGIPRQIKLIDDCINHKIIAHGVNKDGRTIAYVGKLTEEVKPISLTPAILEKNGFLANRHVYPYPYYELIDKEHKLKIGFAFPQGNRTSYKEPWVYIDSENVFVEHLPCMFVHQLQHALRVCGIKKEIEL
jgi:hypothetical protein